MPLPLERWPNRLGWNYYVEHGTAEVRDLGTRLRALVPATPRREWREQLGREILIPQHRICDFPIGTDPLSAVRECVGSGLLRDDDAPLSEPVPFVRLLSLDYAPST